MTSKKTPHFLLKSIAIVLFCLVGGCSTITHYDERELSSDDARLSETEQHASLPALLPVFTPDTAALDRTTLLTQQLSVVFDKTAKAGGAPDSVPPLTAMLSLTPHDIDIVVFAMGLRVWRLSYDTSGLKEERHPFLSSKVRASAFLRDLTFAFWPIEKLSLLLERLSHDDTHYRVEEKNAQRTLFCNDEVVMTLRSTLSASGELRQSILQNLVEHYQLTIETQTSDASSR